MPLLLSGQRRHRSARRHVGPDRESRSTASRLAWCAPAAVFTRISSESSRKRLHARSSSSSWHLRIARACTKARPSLNQKLDARAEGLPFCARELVMGLSRSSRYNRRRFLRGCGFLVGWVGAASLAGADSCAGCDSWAGADSFAARPSLRSEGAPLPRSEPIPETGRIRWLRADSWGAFRGARWVLGSCLPLAPAPAAEAISR